MQRLNGNPELSGKEVRAMQRLQDDEGAVAVVVALLMVVAMLFAAVVIDVGALYSERRQLQNGTDAAALAQARICALTPSDDPCVADLAMARELMDANANDGKANVDAVLIDESEPEIASRGAGSAETVFAVTVQGSTEETDGTNAVPHSFASIVGIDATTVGADATAAWGAPSAGQVILPIAFAECMFDLSGVDHWIKYNTADATDCDPAEPHLPGAFAWLNTDGSTCGAYIEAGVQTLGEPGNSFPGQCADELAGLQNEIILLPIYDDSGGTGSGVWYEIKGFAAFRLTGYKFSGNSALSWNNTGAQPNCTGNCRGVKGHFEEFVSLDDLELGGVDLGFSAIKLVD